MVSELVKLADVLVRDGKEAALAAADPNAGGRGREGPRRPARRARAPTPTTAGQRIELIHKRVDELARRLTRWRLSGSADAAIRSPGATPNARRCGHHRS